jgi:hypothetical protein
MTVLLMLAWATPAHAASVTWQKRWQYNVKSPLDTFEQPAGAINSTLCAWNDQDRIEDRATGTLDAETTDTQCTVADIDDSNDVIYPKNFAVLIKGNRVDYTAWITSECVAAPPGPLGEPWGDCTGRWDLPAPAYDTTQKAYVVKGCIADPVADAANSPNPLQSYWPQVPGSTGYGVQVNYTLHVAPTTAHAVRQFLALYEVHASDIVDPPQPYSPRFLIEVPCPVNDRV